MPYNLSVGYRPGIRQPMNTAAIMQMAQQRRAAKEEQEGLDVMARMLEKQLQADPAILETFGDEWSKWPSMSNSQKKAFLGGLGAYMGNQVKAREEQAKAEEAALRMAGMRQDLQRKAAEQRAVNQFVSLLQEGQTEPNAPANAMLALEQAPLGAGMRNVMQFAPQPGVRSAAPPMTGVDVARLGLQAGVMDPKIIEQFGGLMQQRFTPGTVQDVPGAPWLKFGTQGTEGGGTFYQVPTDPMKFAGQPSKGRTIPGAPDFVEIRLPDGTRKVLRKPVPNPLAQLLADKTKADSKGKGSNPLDDVAEELRGAVEMIRSRRRKGELTRDQAKAALMALGFTFEDESDAEEQ